MNRLLESALSYARLGWSVIPIQCKDKRPLVEWTEFQKRRSTEQEITDWWTKYPDSNVAVVTGKISGIFVLDVDGEDGKKSIYSKQLPATVIANTGKGTHHYYKTNGTPIPNKVGLLAGIDIRGENGYVVVPPSVHPSGKVYEWAEWMNPEETTISEPPEWLMEALKGNGVIAREPINIGAAIPEGKRNDTIFRYAATMYAKGLWDEEVITLVKAKNALKCIPSLPEYEVETICLSAKKLDSRNHPERHESQSEEIKTFIKPISTLFMESDVKPEYLCFPILEKGTIGFVAGEPKVTKSWLALHIAHALTTGNPILSHFEVVGKKKVLYIQEEDSPALVRSRFELLAKGHNFIKPEDEFFRYSIRSGFRIDSEDWLKRLEIEMEQFKPDLVIFDVLNKIHDLDENDQRDITKVMRNFERIRRGFGCSILIVHHFRKGGIGGSRRGNQMMRGSSVLAGWSENSFYITSAPNKMYEVEFESKTSQIEPFLYGLESVKDEEGKTLSVSVSYKGDASLGKSLENLTKVSEAIRKGYQEQGERGVTIKAVAEATGLGDKTVRQHLKSLEADGAVRPRPITGTGKGQNPMAYVPADASNVVDADLPSLPSLEIGGSGE
jgi:bifunctional DNA primase/polymerase-like protein/AAA domain-containing protein/primase-like protein